MELKDTVQKLLAEGIAELASEDLTLRLNELLRPIQYEAVQWPDKSCVVLRDTMKSSTPSFPWTDMHLKEVKDVFKQIVHGQPVTSDVVNMLVENKWVEDANGELVLSKRTLVQHKEYILALGGRYRECGICGFLVDGAAMHDYCGELLVERRKMAVSGEH
jgi:hypothetical protein